MGILKLFIKLVAIDYYVFDIDGGVGPLYDQVLVKTTAIGDVCE